MRLIRRYTSAVVIAALAATMLAATPATVRADQSDLTYFCSELSEAITYLKSLNSTNPVVAMLLAKAEIVFGQYCK